jgi:putative transposase
MTLPADINHFEVSSGHQSMKRSRFAGERIIGILKEYEAGRRVSELRRNHRVRDASILEDQVQRMDVVECKRLKTLKSENTKLKRLFADAILDNAALFAPARTRFQTGALITTISDPLLPRLA